MRRRTGIKMELASKADQRVLRRFVHVERMDEYCMARKVLMVDEYGISEVRLDGWRKGGLGRQRDDGGGCETMDRKEWRALVHM